MISPYTEDFIKKIPLLYGIMARDKNGFLYEVELTKEQRIAFLSKLEEILKGEFILKKI
jgi:hypothetical protein